MNPETGELLFFLVPGCNFGLKAAVVCFNRTPEFFVHIARRFLACATSHFFDDYPTCEPCFSAKSSQLFMRELHVLMGLPFSEEKHILPRQVADYLGIENDLSATGTTGIVRVRMTPSRRKLLMEMIDGVVEAKRMSDATAALPRSAD